MDKTSDLASEIIQQFGRVKSSRGVWEGHWEEIAQRVLPSYSGCFSSGMQSPGSQKTQYIFDSTAAIALNRFASILDSLLTPRNQTWHRLMVSNPSLQKDRQVILWFEEANRILFKFRYAPKANFSSQNQQNYKSLGAFGSGCLFTDDLKKEVGLRYKHIHLGECHFVENHQGIVDECWRLFKLTARQCMQKWGDKSPDAVKAIIGTAPEQQFEFIHLVRPRAEPLYGRLDYKGMPFEGYYVSVQGQQMLEEEGYTTFPYSISRYEQSANEVYGRSPAMDVLPAIKTLNEEKKTLLKQGHRAVDPVLLAHDDGVMDAFNLRPGAVNYGGVSADGRPLVHALPVGNLAVGKELMDDERQVINDAFLVTLFQILVETPTMTATEVLERTKEKGILLAPTVGRQQSEYLGPLIERELDLLSRQGLLPPMPQALLEAKGEYRIEYDSPLTRAQRAEEASGLMRTVETALNVVNVTQNPEPLDFFDWDVIIPEVSSIQGVPARWMRDMKAVQAIRQGRAQQAQQQQMVQAAPGAASVMNAATKARTG